MNYALVLAVFVNNPRRYGAASCSMICRCWRDEVHTSCDVTSIISRWLQVVSKHVLCRDTNLPTNNNCELGDANEAAETLRFLRSFKFQFLFSSVHLNCSSNPINRCISVEFLITIEGGGVSTLSLLFHKLLSNLFVTRPIFCYIKALIYSMKALWGQQSSNKMNELWHIPSSILYHICLNITLFLIIQRMNCLCEVLSFRLINLYLFAVFPVNQNYLTRNLKSDQNYQLKKSMSTQPQQQYIQVL